MLIRDFKGDQGGEAPPSLQLGGLQLNSNFAPYCQALCCLVVLVA